MCSCVHSRAGNPHAAGSDGDPRPSAHPSVRRSGRSASRTTPPSAMAYTAPAETPRNAPAPAIDDHTLMAASVGRRGGARVHSHASLRFKHAAIRTAFAHRNLEVREAFRTATFVNQTVGRLVETPVGRAASEPNHEEGLRGAVAFGWIPRRGRPRPRRSRTRPHRRRARRGGSEAINVDDVARLRHAEIVGTAGGST